MREHGAAAEVNVDFRAARRQIDAQSQFPASTRRSAFAAYVGLYDFADAEGRVAAPAEQLAAAIGTTRVTWLHLRQVLQAADLLKITEHPGGRVPVTMQLQPPHRA